MKVVIAICLAVAAVVLSENCEHLDDCELTACSANLTIGCLDNYCTCTSDTSCALPDDCEHLGECLAFDHQWHCLDGRCRCRTFFG